MEPTKTSNDHVLITPPDRYWSEAYSILLIDFDWGLLENIINPLRSSNVDLAIHVYGSQDTDPQWLLDAANFCDTVLMDLNQNTANDIIKGQLISKHNVWYTGRRDLHSLWPRYTADPLATLLIAIDQHQTSRTEK